MSKLHKDGCDIHGFDKVTLVYFVLVNTKTDKVALVISETAFCSRNKCHFGPIYKDDSDIHGFDKVTLVYFVLVNTKTDKVTLVLTVGLQPKSILMKIPAYETESSW